MAFGLLQLLCLAAASLCTAYQAVSHRHGSGTVFFHREAALARVGDAAATLLQGQRTAERAAAPQGEPEIDGYSDFEL